MSNDEKELLHHDSGTRGVSIAEMCVSGTVNCDCLVGGWACQITVCRLHILDTELSCRMSASRSTSFACVSFRRILMFVRAESRQHTTLFCCLLMKSTARSQVRAVSYPEPRLWGSLIAEARCPASGRVVHAGSQDDCRANTE